MTDNPTASIHVYDGETKRKRAGCSRNSAEVQAQVADDEERDHDEAVDDAGQSTAHDAGPAPLIGPRLERYG